MKKLITPIILFISAIVLLSSCSSKLSLTKRHYRKGYYVNNTHKHATPKINDDKKITINNPTITEPILEENVYAQPIISNEILLSDATKNYSGNKELTQTQINYFKPKELKQTLNANAPSIKKQLFQFNKLTKSSGERDALSLFWIVILVILILWLLGFLAGGFGLGGLINLLLVVALILLILWLLRVI